MERIGTYTLTEDTDFRTSEEVACWYRTIRVTAGDYPVEAEVRNDEVVDTSVTVKMPGTIVEAHFPSLFGGVAYGSGERPGMIGQPATYFVRPYAHSLAWALIHNDDCAQRIELDEAFEARIMVYSYECSIRLERTEGITAGIFRSGERTLEDDAEQHGALDGYLSDDDRLGYHQRPRSWRDEHEASERYLRAFRIARQKRIEELSRPCSRLAKTVVVTRDNRLLLAGREDQELDPHDNEERALAAERGLGDFDAGSD